MRCCNPLKKTKHSKTLRSVTDNIINLFPSLTKSSKVCDSCRLKIENQNVNPNDYTEIISNLKETCNNQNLTSSEKKLILSILPQSWGQEKKASFLGVSRKFVRKIIAKDNSKLENCIDSRTKKRSDSISDQVKHKVQEFYNSVENSKEMSGMKNVVYIENERTGEKEPFPKKLIMCNLRELFAKFKKQSPDIKIGFSKFAQYRPRNCVFAGSSGTHSVCVCVYHQNVKLMLEGVDISKVTSGQLNDYKDCIAMITCKSASSSCHLNECKNCPTVDTFKLYLQNTLNELDIDEVKYNVWESTNRTNLHTRIVSTEFFVNELSKLLFDLKPLSFISKQQSSYVKSIENSLKQDEVLVLLDFSENYAFVVQEAVNSFHYNNNQCTIATAVMYYRDEALELKHHSFAFLSDSLSHDSVSVHCILKVLTDHIKSNIKLAKKVIYFSDGAAQHFKNKYNFINLLNHQSDFGLEAEWHFHATAHGKNVCDGIGAIIKCTARRTSLQRFSNGHILTPDDLFQWAKVKFTQSISIHFYSQVDYDSAKEKLKTRYENAKTVTGTLSFHSIKVVNNQFECKRFSTSETAIMFNPVSNKRPANSKVSSVSKKLKINFP